MKKTRKAAGAKPIKDRARVYSAPSAPPLKSPIGSRGVYTQLGFYSVRVAARDGLVATPGAGDLHLLYNRAQLQNKSRELARDSGFYQGPIEKLVGYIVGSGFGFQARTSDKKWNALAEAWWKDEVERIEISGLWSWLQVQQLIVRELITMGDVGVLKTDRGKIQIFESEQIAGPTLRDDGLVRDSFGAITAFNLCQYETNGQIQPTKARKVAAEHFMFLMKPDRPSSKRAVPPLQAAFSMVHRTTDICDSEAAARQTQSKMAIIVNKENAGLDALSTSSEDPAKVGVDGQLTGRTTEIDNAMIFNGGKGETVTGMERTAPGADFTQTMTMFLRLLGLPINLPIEIILLDWSKSNYSQSRAVLEQAYQSFVPWQALLEQRFYRPLWIWKAEQAIANGDLPANDEFARHEWIKPTLPWIDQKAEADAAGAQLDRGLATHSDVLKSKNKDRDEVVDGIVAEIEDAMTKAAAIEAKFPGQKVPWQILCGKSYSVNEETKGEEADPAAEVGSGAGEPKPRKDGEEEAKVEQPPPAPAAKPEPLVEKEVSEITERDEKGRAKTIVTRRKFREGA